MDPKEIDKENLIEMIKAAPGQLEAGLELAKDIKVAKKFDSIVLSGMGGSALVADLLITYFYSKLQAPERPPLKIYINRSYALPPESYEPGCLNIFSSFSGNTEETISCFYDALKNNLSCLGITSGGKLAAICQENNVPLIILPVPAPSFQPRLAIGYSFSSLMQLFANCGILNINPGDFRNAAKKIKADEQVFSDLGIEIAKKLKDKTPVIYASNKFRALAMIWKIMFNENTKITAFWNFFPELSHNEMVGFTNPKGPFHLLMLRDRNDFQKNIKRFAISADIFKEYGIDSTTLDIPEGDIIYRIFATLQIGCFASYHLAIQYGTDPTPVEMVEKLKKLLAS